MKLYLTLTVLMFFSCQNSKQEKVKVPTTQKESFSVESAQKKEAEFLDSTYKCENAKFSSVLEEIPNRDSNAFKLTITSKENKNKFTKILDTRPGMSKINYCNDLYTVVSFPCGGPCYSQVFIFTDKNRPIEQYAYSQEVKNNSTIIGHIKDEEFEKLIIHNFLNSKELTVDISDMSYWNSGQLDSMVIKNDNLILYYQSKNEKQKTRSVNLKSIL